LIDLQVVEPHAEARDAVITHVGDFQIISRRICYLEDKHVFPDVYLSVEEVLDLVLNV